MPLNAMQITVAGNVAGPAELKLTDSGIARASFSLAVTPRKNEGGTWRDGETTWINVTAWRELAENVAESIGKGDRVIVTGQLETRKYTTKDGRKGISLDLTAEDLGPSLAWTGVKVTPNGAPAGDWS